MQGLQLPLGVQLAEHASLDNFFGGPNGDVLAAARAVAAAGGPALLVLFGAPGSGKSHLLQAVTAQAARHCAAAYVPLRPFADDSPEALEGMDALDLVCLDDIDAVAQRSQWLVAVLRMLDGLRARGARCVVSAGAAPERLALGLADLQTRLAAGAVYGLRPLGDAERAGLLRERAAQRGLQLAEDAGRYLLAQLPRDTGSLLAALEHLDRDSLSAQRRLSLAFVTDWLRRNPPVQARQE